MSSEFRVHRSKTAQFRWRGTTVDVVVVERAVVLVGAVIAVGDAVAALVAGDAAAVAALVLVAQALDPQARSIEPPVVGVFLDGSSRIRDRIGSDRGFESIRRSDG